jgi:hypothetical protein
MRVARIQNCSVGTLRYWKIAAAATYQVVFDRAIAQVAV